jgi:hypothetical protein
LKLPPYNNNPLLDIQNQTHCNNKPVVESTDDGEQLHLQGRRRRPASRKQADLGRLTDEARRELVQVHEHHKGKLERAVVQMRKEEEELREQHEAELGKVLEDRDKNACVEIGFKKRFLTAASAAPKFALKQRSATFVELAKLAIKTDTVSDRLFEYKERTIPTADYCKTLKEVSSVIARTGHGGQSANFYILAWL